MQEDKPTAKDVDRFVQQEIDTVPQLEALLLIWKARPKCWRLDELAAALYISAEAAKDVVEPLERRGLLTSQEGQYTYCAGSNDELIAVVDLTYRRELIRITRMIHSKAPAAVREFARAFLFKKDRD
jgi:predicted DNA-binding transcriptional regulator